jgi:MraZ protein
VWEKVGESRYLYAGFQTHWMTRFLGEYDCKLDGKGRFALPAALRKQVPQEAADRFVINRGLDQCLNLYPKNEWDIITEEINRLNPYEKDNRDFIRFFYRGALELSLDNAGRLLIPKRLQEYAGIDKDIVLFAHTNKIEVWSQEAYDTQLDREPEDFAALAQRVMGNKGGLNG